MLPPPSFALPPLPLDNLHIFLVFYVQRRITATVLNSFTPMSKADVCAILPDVSPTTVEAVLGEMVRTGRIRKLGSGRGTRYLKA